MNYRKRILATILVVIALALPAIAKAAGCTVLDASGRVLQCGTNLGPTVGATNYELSPSTLHALATAAAGVGGSGVALTSITGPDGSGNYSGSVSVLPTPTAGPTTTLTLNANAGSGATIGFVPGSNLQRGGITWTTGLAPSLGVQFTVTFPQAFGGTPYADCRPVGINAATLNLTSIPSATSVQVRANIAPLPSTTYVCQYLVVS